MASSYQADERTIDIYPYASDIRIAMNLACTMAHLAQRAEVNRN